MSYLSINITTSTAKYQAVKLHDYHPPMPLPDPEAPEKSLGDCSICMDSIHIDPSLRPKATQEAGKEGWIGDSGDGMGASMGIGRNMAPSAGGLLNVVQKGVVISSRREYSLAPCHHLFVSCLILSD